MSDEQTTMIVRNKREFAAAYAAAAGVFNCTIEHHHEEGVTIVRVTNEPRPDARVRQVVRKILRGKGK